MIWNICRKQNFIPIWCAPEVLKTVNNIYRFQRFWKCWRQFNKSSVRKYRKGKQFLNALIIQSENTAYSVSFAYERERKWYGLTCHLQRSTLIERWNSGLYYSQWSLRKPARKTYIGGWNRKRGSTFTLPLYIELMPLKDWCNWVGTACSKAFLPLLHCKMPRPIGHIQPHCIKIISNFGSHSIEKGARDGF